MIDEKLYTRALKFLARRPRSEKEISDNLKKKKATPQQIAEIIQLLTQQNFLDDVAFAKWWVEQRQILKPMGWRVLALELKQKGISKEIIEELRFKIPTYANASSGEQDSAVKTEYDLAIELGKKRFKRLQGAPKDEVYRKLGGFLARRGFDLDTIKAVIDQLLQK
jgi:regulatory protein